MMASLRSFVSTDGLLRAPSVLLLLLLSSDNKGAWAASCFDGTSPFHPDQWSYCQDITDQGELFLYYNPIPVDGNLLLGLHATNHDTGGWSSLALGGNGGMKGASQIVVRRENDQDDEWIAEDRHSDDYATPMLDDKQNVRLLFAEQDAGKTAWGVLLMMNSCDVDHDYSVWNEDASRWMHWALGSSHTFGYHGVNRGQFHANLLAPPKETPDLSDLLSMDIVMPDVPVVLGEGGQDASNPYICSFFDLNTLLPAAGATGGADDKHHAVHMSPILHDASAEYTHHMLLYSCDTETITEAGAVHNQVIGECENMPPGCTQIKFAWAVGGQDIALPPDVGVPFGEGDNWLVLQMHYYNPSLDENIVDRSGVRVYMSPTLRDQDAGFLELNGGTDPSMRGNLPPGLPNIALNPFVIPGNSDCTGQWNDTLNVLGAFHHMHLVGSHMRIDVERNGTFVGTVRQEHHYDFNHQSFEESSVKILLPGDQINMYCSYDTSSRTLETAFGDLSQQEMCYGLIFYYPRQPQRESFGYFELPEEIVPVCQTAGFGPFSQVSLCAQVWATNMPAFYQIEDSEGSFSAADYCNGQAGSADIQPSAPFICPEECHSFQNCTDFETATHAQNIHCPDLCNEFGLSTYPDLGRPYDESNIGLWCESNDNGGDNDDGDEEDYFEGFIRRPNIAIRPDCEPRGDLSKANDFVLLTSDGVAPTLAPTLESSASVSRPFQMMGISVFLETIVLGTVSWILSV